MKRISALLAAMMLFLPACAPVFDKQEEVVQDTANKDEEAIIPKYKISDNYYQTVLPFKPSDARGLVAANINSRLDIDEFENGLMRLAQRQFPSSTYLFQEGQFLSKDTIKSWLERKMTAEQLKKAKKSQSDNVGLNPILEGNSQSEAANAKSPIYLAHMLEHNYLKKNEDGKVELGGVVIGLAMNSAHEFQNESGYDRSVSLNNEVVEQKGKEIAQEVVQRIRKKSGLSKVPIVVALFKQQPMTSISPGNFFSIASVPEGSSAIGKWEGINEKYAIFPSPEANDDFREDAQRFEDFKQDIAKYFPNFTGVVGRGFYQGNELKKLTLEIPLQFYGKSEVVGFTQYVTGKIIKNFPDYIPVEVYISSASGPESIIVREKGQAKPFVHIYN